MKILINTPFITSPAGVSNHYLGLKNYFSKRVVYNQYATRFYVRKVLRSKYLYTPTTPLVYSFHFLKFIFLIFRHNRPNILLNPSFGKTALIRDAQYLKTAKFFGCKVAVFVHGWDKAYLDQVLKNSVLFCNAWYKADAFFVLASEFKEYFQRLGIKAPIHLTTTKVNDKLVEGLEPKKIKDIKTILFLARVEKAKGIFTAINVFEILNKKYPDLRLQVVGRGEALEEAKIFADKKQLKNIVFTGALSGDDLKNEFINADLYILPTYHGEGMPTSVLEAMAFGLPVITRPVGGLIDFFENEKMGYMIESLEPEDFVLHTGLAQSCSHHRVDRGSPENPGRGEPELPPCLRPVPGSPAGNLLRASGGHRTLQPALPFLLCRCSPGTGSPFDNRQGMAGSAGGSRQNPGAAVRGRAHGERRPA
jgi:glycosyltransferase involved in cell wall biosynthesis